MTRKETSSVLGLLEGALRETISIVDRRIMISSHPSNGETTYVATKVDEAKD